MYDKMFEFVNKHLENNDCEASKIGFFRFRKRTEHIMRVFTWARRLVDSEVCVNKEAVLVSAIFHDVGYALKEDNTKHAENSATLCKKYLNDNGFDTEFTDFIVYLVKNHSNKELMTSKDTPLELILLMEADLLVETGALSIIWDCMMEGAQEIQTFEKTYDHILNYSYKALTKDPMITPKGKEFWESKRKLVQEFVNQLSYDLGLNYTKI
ncbi:MAG: HD domain-containing protein [Clostridiales bacterium]|nr:HD domain-containing protein [Clostridiales bacterium]